MYETVPQEAVWDRGVLQRERAGQSVRPMPALSSRTRQPGVMPDGGSEDPVVWITANATSDGSVRLFCGFVECRLDSDGADPNLELRWSGGGD
jgi:hypothetical protein